MAQENRRIIKTYLSQVSATLANLPVDTIAEVVALIETARESGKKIFTFGNGGSAATASHFASDLAKGAISRGKPRIKAFARSEAK